MHTGLKVNIYGDSIMRGTVVDENFRYRAAVAEEFAQFAEKFGFCIANQSRFGITSEKGKKILEKDVAAGLFCDYALLEFGGNDCNFNWSAISLAPEEEHLPFTVIEAFEAHYCSMIEALHQAGVTPVLMTLPPIDSVKYLEFVSRGGNSAGRILHWLGDVHMIYRFHEMYSNAIARIAEKMGAVLIDVRRKFLDKHNFTTLIGPDGIHLNREGYQLLFASLSEFVTQALHAPGALALA